MYKLIFYVPPAACEKVKQAVFATGAGTLGKYAECCWQTMGQGQFRPLQGANPTVGEVEQLETLPELRVEILCSEENIRLAISALKEAHPYEEVAYEVLSVENHRFN